ncbi:MAG TPA: discoidin domain-containing protein, partial [Verrucomicrobiae bacterium]|nr:discoidin domain-containing protein [Verrucomicrobiae bacterium]
MRPKIVVRPALLATFATFLLFLPFSSVNADYLGRARQAPASSAGVAKKILVPVNLALNKPATASGFQPGHDPAHAVDGNPDTRWCAPDNGNGHWW